MFLDDSRLGDVVDRNYLISTLRQHLLASGCQLRDKRDQADFIVEARAGAIGTDRNDLLFGVPSMNVPQISQCSRCRRRFPRFRSPSGATSGHRQDRRVRLSPRNGHAGLAIGVGPPGKLGERRVDSRRRTVSAGHDLRRHRVRRQNAGPRTSEGEEDHGLPAAR